MRSFIEDYLQHSASAVNNAINESERLSWTEGIEEELIYEQIASPEFRLYEAMIFCISADDLRVMDSFRPVA